MSVTIIEDMIGQIFREIEINESRTLLMFRGDYHRGHWGRVFTFFHEYDCCESVWIEDITGDLDDLTDSVITEAEVVTETRDTDEGSQTWSFFKFGTKKGCVTVRWCGESNGFYSESVSLKIEKAKVITF
ncbi:DUF7448 domain-containing protein [Salmonella enterica]|uniref:DUF7448 domain-containing protein n=1 Tax=Salmonella enterica TaxID=28901 RepID=UPI0003BD12E5|nr:hypothetical protein [Salmonella enterica]AUM42528.1 hypothetical protein SEEP1673_022835 [Salmonella enterica subsp. enterica serovar Poona str. ATCC BAA-1673]ECC1805672.1 hypothetical protein [Salmonella enterica]